jgi:hypothetical protein
MSRPLRPDWREFREARWWTRAEIERAGPERFDPHMNRMLGKFDRSAVNRRRPGRTGAPAP